MSMMASPYFSEPASLHQQMTTLMESSLGIGVTMTTAYMVSSGSTTL